ncbi:MAG: transglutaminase-like domain-containing protein [Patescibacteria group bacterium]
MKKLFFSLLASLLVPIYLLVATETRAQQTEINAFENKLISTYTVNELGNTYVEHTFSIKNLTPTYYITKHGLKTSSPNITNIRVFDQQGNNFNAEITKVENQTNIGITFPDKLVGEGKVRTFTISYNNPDLAQVNGNVLEIAIPKQADSNQYQQAEVVLNTPLRFGNATRVTPASNFTQKLTDKGIQMTFSELKNQGVSALFGIDQIFDLNFTYFLENNDSQPILLQTALPPDTSFQRMHYHSIDPLPTEMEIDQDGNWIATFYMPGNTAQTVKVQAQALLTLNKNPDIPVSYPQSFHLSRQPFWEIDNKNLQQIAEENKTPQAIYNYVTTTLEYQTIDSLEDFERKGAAQIIGQPTTAACQEFSDLFVTIARINNIPARVVTGYAYTQNNSLRPLSLVEDILHAWPEYWDETNQVWQPTDPTWGNTTGGVDYFNQFDLNHIVLAINGQSSTLPYPAGSYKTEQQQTEKTLEVLFGKNFPSQKPELTADLTKSENNWLKMPGFYQLTLVNNSGAAWYKLTFDLSSNKSGVRVFGDTSIPAILPFQTISIPIFVYNTQQALPEKDNLVLNVSMNGGSILQKDFTVTNAPNFIQNFAHPYIPFFLGGTAIILALGTGSVLVFRRKK